ncbi:MAG TPA: DUF58 domain-containing protein [Terriglobales bacterium]|nr:DUF58 domain-containing protein [Terriglobales bacterium]
MIAPDKRALWLAAALILPALTLTGLGREFIAPCLGFVCVVLAAAFLDAQRTRKQLDELCISIPQADHNWAKKRPAVIEVTLSGQPGTYDFAFDLPPGLSAVHETTTAHIGNTDLQTEPVERQRAKRGLASNFAAPNFERAVHGVPRNSLPVPGLPVPYADFQRSRLADFSTILPVTCIPEERGRYHIETCFVRTRSPWRLWRVYQRRTIHLDVRVFPDLASEPGARILFRKQQLGLRKHRPIGRGKEFERLREYAHGDSFDEIYWKATARRGSPIVKVFQVERTQDIYAVVDTSFRSARGGRLERFLNGALMLALTAEKEGDNFGLVTFDRQVARFVPAARGKRHFTRCREAIFDVQPQRVAPDFSELFTFLQLRIRKRALLLCLTDLEDPIAAEAFLAACSLLARKHVVVVAAMRDDAVQPLFPNVSSDELPSDVSGIYHRLAGHLHWASLLETGNKLNRVGVRVRALRPASVGLDLVDEYEEIKRRQIL